MVTHPFHPLFGKRLVVVFERRCPVHERLFVCEAGPARRVAFPIRWTDRTPDVRLEQRLGPEGLAALVELLESLHHPRFVRRDRS